MEATVTGWIAEFALGSRIRVDARFCTCSLGSMVYQRFAEQMSNHLDLGEFTLSFGTFFVISFFYMKFYTLWKLRFKTEPDFSRQAADSVFYFQCIDDTIAQFCFEFQ